MEDRVYSKESDNYDYDIIISKNKGYSDDVFNEDKNQVIFRKGSLKFILKVQYNEGQFFITITEQHSKHIEHLKLKISIIDKVIAIESNNQTFMKIGGMMAFNLSFDFGVVISVPSKIQPLDLNPNHLQHISIILTDIQDKIKLEQDMLGMINYLNKK